eukprot:scaffold46613_cov67-Phaeocystis_antarctica.AAC.2
MCVPLFALQKRAGWFSPISEVTGFRPAKLGKWSVSPSSGGKFAIETSAARALPSWQRNAARAKGAAEAVRTIVTPEECRSVQHGSVPLVEGKTAPGNSSSPSSNPNHITYAHFNPDPDPNPNPDQAQNPNPHRALTLTLTPTLTLTLTLALTLYP